MVLHTMVITTMTSLDHTVAAVSNVDAINNVDAIKDVINLAAKEEEREYAMPLLMLHLTLICSKAIKATTEIVTV
jgi:hypothetical protein